MTNDLENFRSATLTNSKEVDDIHHLLQQFSIGLSNCNKKIIGIPGNDRRMKNWMAFRGQAEEIMMGVVVKANLLGIHLNPRASCLFESRCANGLETGCYYGAGPPTFLL
eukprot:Gb_03255 [translate_table: standard]